jgi:hypothetical protein
MNLPVKKACTLLLCVVLTSALLAAAPSSFAQERSPYGSGKSGYGEKRPVKNAEEARKVLAEYFEEKKVKLGEVKEKDYFFEAEVFDGDGRLIDKVIVDKRTGRVRSIY